MWISTYYGSWDYWNLYHKVSFDGSNRIININYGETSINVETDIYSDWKEWSLLRDNTKYLYAISAIGGESIGGGNFVGSTFFLENGWRIKPWEGSHNLSLVGNLYTREEGESPYLNTNGNWKINITNTISSLVYAVETQVPITGSSATVDVDAIAEAVWRRSVTGSMAVDTFGDHVYRKLLNLAQYMATK